MKRNSSNNDEGELLHDATLKKNPFSVPEGYFDSVEEKIMNRVAEAEAETETHQTGSRGILKAAAGLAAAFAMVFGIGYGTLRLTGTADWGKNKEKRELVQIRESGLDSLFIKSNFIDFLAEDLAIYESGMENYETSASMLDEDTIISYLTTDLSSSDILYYTCSD